MRWAFVVSSLALSLICACGDDSTTPPDSTVSTELCTYLPMAATARAGGTVTAAFDSVAVAVGFGVGVTRTWNPPQANMANSHIASAKYTGQ